MDLEASCSYESGVAVDDSSAAEWPWLVVDVRQTCDSSARIETPPRSEENGEVVLGRRVEAFYGQTSGRTIGPPTRDRPVIFVTAAVALDVGDAVRQAVQGAGDNDGEERGSIEREEPHAGAVGTNHVGPDVHLREVARRRDRW